MSDRYTNVRQLRVRPGKGLPMDLDEMKATTDKHPDDRWRRLIALYEAAVIERDELQRQLNERG